MITNRGYFYFLKGEILMEKKKYLRPIYEVEVIELNDAIFTSGAVNKSDGNHQFGGNPDLSL